VGDVVEVCINEEKRQYKQGWLLGQILQEPSSGIYDVKTVDGKCRQVEFYNIRPTFECVPRTVWLESLDGKTPSPSTASSLAESFSTSSISSLSKSSPSLVSPSKSFSDWFRSLRGKPRVEEISTTNVELPELTKKRKKVPS